jgi:hypothetical protein
MRRNLAAAAAAVTRDRLHRRNVDRARQDWEASLICARSTWKVTPSLVASAVLVPAQPL